MKRVFWVLLILFVCGYGFAGENGQDQAVSKDILPLLGKIKSIEPVYDDCQLIFYVKGSFFAPQQGAREVRMESGPFLYKPEITGWSATKIDCLLKGDFELGLTYHVYIYDTVANKVVSNKYPWLVKTQLKMPVKGYRPGEKANIGGHLLGSQVNGRELRIGNVSAPIDQWACEDILFTVPVLKPGTHKVVLKKGALILSNITSIRILGPIIVPLPHRHPLPPPPPPKRRR